MILRTGTYTFEDTGEVKNRALIFGRTIKDAELKSVGSRGTSLLNLRVVSERGGDIMAVKMWGYDAIDYADIKKGATVLIDAYEDTRDWQGKTYTDWVVINVIAVSERTAKSTGKGTRASVKPENPANTVDDGFTDLVSNDLPWETGEFN